MTFSASSSFAPKSAGDSKWLASIEWLLIVATAAYHCCIGPHEIWGDGAVRYDTLVKLIDHGEVTASLYSIMHSFLAAPLYLLGKPWDRAQQFASYFNVVLFYLALILFYGLLRRQWPSALLRRTILIVVAASMFGNNIQNFYGEVLTACTAMLAFAALSTNRPILSGIAMCISVVNTPAAALGLVLCNGWWGWRTRRWFHAVWPVCLSATLIVLEFWWRRGSPIQSGYEGKSGIPTFMPYSGLPGFSYPILLGLLSLLFSFGRGILIYAPGLLLHHVPTRSKKNPAVSMFAELSMAFFWGMVLAYSAWWCWYGAWCWGPRFLLVACVPASFALARHITDAERKHLAVTALVVVSIVWSAWVGINGTVIREVETEPCMSNNFNLEAICFYIPEFSPLIHPLIKPKALMPWDRVEVLLGSGVAVVLLLPFLWIRARDFSIRTLSRASQGKS